MAGIRLGLADSKLLSSTLTRYVNQVKYVPLVNREWGWVAKRQSAITLKSEIDRQLRELHRAGRR